LGEDIASSDSSWAKEGRTPFDVLLSWQSESGAFQVNFGMALLTISSQPSNRFRPLW
jgi:hypothetical protein